MEEEKRKKIIRWTIIALIVAGVLFIIMRLSDRQPNQPGSNGNSAPEFTPPSVNLEYEPVEPSQSDTEFSVINLAKSYTERFGSWSTDAEGYNLKELLPLSSVSMQNYLNSIEVGDEAGDFSGVTTKSISAEILFLDDSEASVLVKTQRIETDNNLNENVYYQDIMLTIVDSAGNWVVDEASWQ